MQSHRLGERGEAEATEYLRSRGYEILELRYKRRGGEIDIICQLRERREVSLIVFVEVKTRRPSLFGRPEQAVSRQKLRRIYRTAQVYLHEHPHPGILCRFDVMAVYSIRGRLEIEHFEDAFGAFDLLDME